MIVSRILKTLAGAASVPAIALVGATALATAGGVTTASAEEMSSITRGALLYDKWYKMVGGAEEPDETHPSYPTDAKKSGGSTWRCKECHGWDYKGVDGAYGGGSHRTGIKGVNGMAGADPADIIAVLQDDTHGFGDLMAEEDFTDLANFVSKGQIDTSKYINADKSLIGADAERGAEVYAGTCARCHREDGRRPKDMEKPLGGLMSNPWEVMHKIQNGHPGQNMPAFRVFGEDVAVDVMAYLLTLPKE